MDRKTRSPLGRNASRLQEPFLFRCTAVLVIALLVFSLAGCRETATLPRATASGDGAAGETVSAGHRESTEEVERSIIPPKDPITLTFIGDIMAHKNNYSMPDYNDIYKDIKDLFIEDDLTFGNLEFPVCEDLPMSTFPAFNVHPPYVEAAINAGVEIFSCANNHTTDKGPEGIKKTYAAMQEFEGEHGIYFSGIRKNIEKPYRAEYILYKRWEIGFLAATEHLNTHWGSEYVHIVDYHDEEVLASFLELLRKETEAFDLFILSFHGGKEYRLLPMKQKVEFFEKCLQSGVDIIWAHHPHVLQPWSLEKRPAGDKLVLYSTGNFISGQAYFLDPKTSSGANPYTGEGAVFQVRLRDVGDKPVIHSVSTVPIANYKHPTEGTVVRRHIRLPSAPDVPEAWRRYYAGRLPETAVLTADYTIPNILP